MSCSAQWHLSGLCLELVTDRFAASFATLASINWQPRNPSRRHGLPWLAGSDYGLFSQPLKAMSCLRALLQAGASVAEVNMTCCFQQVPRWLEPPECGIIPWQMLFRITLDVLVLMWSPFSARSLEHPGISVRHRLHRPRPKSRYLQMITGTQVNRKFCNSWLYRGSPRGGCISVSRCYVIPRLSAR